MCPKVNFPLLRLFPVTLITSSCASVCTSHHRHGWRAPVRACPTPQAVAITSASVSTPLVLPRLFTGEGVGGGALGWSLKPQMER